MADQPEAHVDLRTVPLGLAAWLGSLAGLVAASGVERATVAAIIGALFVGAIFRPSARRLLIATGLVALVAVGMAAGRQAVVHSSLVAQAADSKAIVVAEVRLASDPISYPAKGFLPARVQAPGELNYVEHRGSISRAKVPVQLAASGELGERLKSLPAGSTIRVMARAAPAKPGRHFAAILNLREPPDLIAGPKGFFLVANHVRHALHESVTWATDEQAGLVPSLVVGDVSALSQTTRDDFQTTGLTHLTAVSGTNLTLMLAFLLPVAKRLGLRKHGLTALAVGAVVAFVLICRSEPSVVRAGAMGLVALSATGLAADRRRGLRHLGTAVLLLTLSNPWLAVNWGFALSVVASAAILWWGSVWQLRLRQWLPGPLAEAIAIPLAAQLATQPIVTKLSGEISAVGVLANALTGPFVGPVTVLGLGAGVVGSIAPIAAKPIGWLAGWCIQPVLSVAHYLAALPAASWKWPTDTYSLIMLVTACLVVGVLVPILLAKPWTTVLLALALIVGSIFAPRQPGWPGDWLTVTCDVGQGDARLLRTGPRSAMLVDVGPEAKLTLECLHSVGVVEVPAILITHGHADHVAGLKGVLQKFPGATLITGPATAAKLRALREPFITRPGDGIQIGWLKWWTLGAEALPAHLPMLGEGESSIENDTGVAGIAQIADLRILIAGDREPPGQQSLLATGVELRADILSMPHHGSSRQEPEFFKASGAKIATASAGAGNSYGHPSASAIRLAQSHGMRVYRTDQDGSIAIGKSRGGLIVVTQR